MPLDSTKMRYCLKDFPLETVILRKYKEKMCLCLKVLRSHMVILEEEKLENKAVSIC